MATVLIIDDALFMRQMIRNALESVGFTIVAEAENGKEGVEKYKTFNPQLVTLDIVMNEMDGLETLKHIRTISQKTKIVIITAIDQRQSMLKAMQLGVSDFVVKPFTEDRIISAVTKTFNRDLNSLVQEPKKEHE